MLIHENLDNYRITLEQADLIQIGKPAEQISEDLKEASALIGKPLGAYTSTYDPMNCSWVIFIEKNFC